MVDIKKEQIKPDEESAETEVAVNIKNETEPEEIIEAVDEEAIENEETEEAEETEETEETEEDSVKSELLEALTKRDEYLSMAQRIQAEFMNYKRRNETALTKAFGDGTADAVKSILSILDNLERAVEAATAEDDGKHLTKGVEMVLKQFKELLGKMGVEEIIALGSSFDPNLHDAVMRCEVEDGTECNTVVAVMQKGYMLKDRVLRHAMVKVAM